jgi:hypothetical protein
MSRAKFHAWVAAIYLVANLIFTRIVGIPFSSWLILAFIMAVSLIIFARLEKRKRNRDPMDDLELVTAFIKLDRRAWRHFERQWIGKRVRLKEDIRNSREPLGLQLYVQAGTMGKIVGLNGDERAPFVVEFPGFGPQVAVRLKKLDLNPTENILEQLDIA